MKDHKSDPEAIFSLHSLWEVEDEGRRVWPMSFGLGEEIVVVGGRQSMLWGQPSWHCRRICFSQSGQKEGQGKWTKASRFSGKTTDCPGSFPIAVAPVRREAAFSRSHRRCACLVSEHEQRCIQLLVVRGPHKVKSDQRLLVTEKRILETAKLLER